eukprot:SAG31_NODE_119_length_23948_cov_9.957105_13_plen_58_part_00
MTSSWRVIIAGQLLSRWRHADKSPDLILKVSSSRVPTAHMVLSKFSTKIISMVNILV